MKHLRLLGICVVAMFLVAGCKGSDKQGSGPGSAAAGSAVPAGSNAGSAAGAGAGSAADASGSAAGAPAAGPYLPAKLSEKEGIVFAETKGGTVEMTLADGSTKKVADGTRVKITEEGSAEMGESDPVTHKVEVEGAQGTILATRVLAENNLKRSPDGKFAVFIGDDSCGDLCHTALSIVGADGARAKLGDGVVDNVVAWHKDGAQAAIGSGTLWLVTLPSLEVKPLDEYTSPSYAPDGTLYARNHDGSAFVFKDGTPKQVWKAKPRKSNPDEGDYGAEQPSPVTFDGAGKPNYAVKFGVVP